MTVQNIRRRLHAVAGGFTLIELLIVMAILGVLAVVVLVAINPTEQLRRARDAGRESAVTQIGHALTAYATTNTGSYVTENATWVDSLVSAGEVSVVPSAVAYSGSVTACTNAAQNDWCYDYDTTNEYIIAYAALESDSKNNLCTGTDEGFFVYSSADGRGGVVCVTTATEPTAGLQTFAN